MMAEEKKHHAKDKQPEAAKNSADQPQDAPRDEAPAPNIEMPDLEKMEGEYGVGQIRVLSDLEHVRQRSGMYIGNTESSGLHQLVYEAVDNSIDEAMAGHAHEVSVTINVDGSINVSDDGRGIPVETHPDLGISTLEGVMTKLKFGGKFDKRAYKTSGGLHGIGVKAVNFLSEWCEVEVRRDGHVYQQEYERGVPTGPCAGWASRTRPAPKPRSSPIRKFSALLKFDYNILHRRLQELAFLNKGVKIAFHDLRNGQGETFQYDRGLLQFIEHLNRASEPLHRDIIYVAREHGKRGRGSGPAVHGRIHRPTNTRSSTTSTPSTAARTCPAFARPSPGRCPATARRTTSSKT